MPYYNSGHDDKFHYKVYQNNSKVGYTFTTINIATKFDKNHEDRLQNPTNVEAIKFIDNCRLAHPLNKTKLLELC